MALTWGQALSWRLCRHLLHPVATVSVGDVVGRLGAVPAYPETTPEFALGLRRSGSRFGDVADALDVGDVFKTYAFRGATHLLTPEEGGAYLALRASGRQWELPSWQETYGLAPGDWPAFRETVREAVAEGPLTRHELAAAVARRRPFRAAAAGLNSTSDALLKSLMWQGDLCFGPQPGVGDRPGPGPRGALGWAAGHRRRGPVGRRGVRPHLRTGERRWGAVLPGCWIERRSQGGPRLARRVIQDRLVAVDIDGEEFLVCADDVDELASTVVFSTFACCRPPTRG